MIAVPAMVIEAGLWIPLRSVQNGLVAIGQANIRVFAEIPSHKVE